MTGSTEENGNANRQDDQAPARGSAGQSNPSQQGANGSFDAITGRFITGHKGYDPRQVLIVSGVPTVIDQVKTPVDLPREFKAGEIIGWRCWRNRPHFSTKRSMHMAAHWRDDKMAGNPQFAQAGVYAWKTREEAESYGYHCLLGAVPDTTLDEEILIGSVYLWGEVIEHVNGYRAEFAKVKDIVKTLGIGDIQTACQKFGANYLYYPSAMPILPPKLPEKKKAEPSAAEIFFVYLGFIGMAISLMLILSLLFPK